MHRSAMLAAWRLEAGVVLHLLSPALCSDATACCAVNACTVNHRTLPSAFRHPSIFACSSMLLC